MRIVALLAAHNEERFIRACIGHHVRHGVEVYLADNQSGDRTVAIAREFEGKGLAGIETIARDETFRWAEILKRKQELAARLDADWFIHLDADEFFIPPRGFATLREAVESFDAAGWNAINAMEYTFVPVRESPEHDHADFLSTMKWYYPFEPQRPHRMCIWKKQRGPVDLVASGGHRVSFPELRCAPVDFGMKHYLCLGRNHAMEKYARRNYDRGEVKAGWHSWRADMDGRAIEFPPAGELRAWTGDDSLDSRNPRARHFID